MKQILFLAPFFISIAAFSQGGKILFDATKAETAGNADWIIDADNYDLGFSNGPAVPGTGSEANAQQIPSPGQNGISGATPETFWSGALSAWGVDMVKKGFTVETLPYNGQISYGNISSPQDLSNYKVFVVCEPNIVFSSSEKTAILNFVQNGGGLFMISDHDVSDRNGDGWDSPHIWNDLMSNNNVQANPFGIAFDYANFSEITSNVPNLPSDSLLNGIMGSVSEAQWANGTSMSISSGQNPTVKGVIYRTGYSFGNTGVMVAHALFGSGRVVAMGDSSPADDGSGDPNDGLYNGWTADASGNHERLIVNATIWLAGVQATYIEKYTQNKISLQQNPCREICTFSTNEYTEADFYLYDVCGNRVYEITNTDISHFRFFSEKLLPGIYFFSFEKNGSNLGRGKLVID